MIATILDDPILCLVMCGLGTLCVICIVGIAMIGGRDGN